MSGVRQSGARFWETATGTNEGVTITLTAVQGKRYVITDIAVASDADTTVEIKSDNTTVWEMPVAADVPLMMSFATPIYGAVGKAMTVTVAASTAACYANVGGVKISN